MNDFTRIPPDLKSIPQWVCWQLTERDGKPTKVPYDPNTGGNARVTDSATWADFETAQAASDKYKLSGVGFVFTKDDTIIGIDVDHLYPKGEGKHADIFKELMPWLLRFKSYKELSQSKTGLHIIIRATLPDGVKNRYVLGEDVGVEVYTTGRYFVMTGNRTKSSAHEVAEQQAELEAFLPELLRLHELESAKTTKTKEKPKPKPKPKAKARTDDDDVLAATTKAWATKVGNKFTEAYAGGGDYESPSNRDFAVAGWLAAQTQDVEQIERLMWQSACVRDKWTDNKSYVQRTIGKAMANRGAFTPNSLLQPMTLRSYKGEEFEVDVDLDPRLKLLVTLAQNGIGNSDRLLNYAGGVFRWVPEFKDFIIWGTNHWTRDNEGKQMVGLAETTIEHTQRLYQEAGLDTKWIDKQQEGHTLNNMVDGVKHKSVKRRDKLDLDPWLLNCENGTIDLKTKELRPHSSSDFITKVIPVVYNPKAKHERWTKFINDTFPDDELRRYVSMALGCALTGVYTDEVFFILQGETCTGKSTLTDAFYSMIGGDYAAVLADISLLKPTSGGAPRPDISRLEGKRFVNCPETEKNETILVSLLKRMCGGDIITARGLYETEREFRPTWKMFIPTNCTIKFPDEDRAVWRRLVIIPFLHEAKNPDTAMKVALREDPACRQAILAWCVAGCKRWQALDGSLGEDKNKPAAVLEATEQYRAEIDPTREFFADRLQFYEGKGKKPWTAFNLIWDNYLAWCDQNPSADTIGQKEMAHKLVARGAQKGTKRDVDTGNKKRGYTGVTIVY